MAGTTPAVCGHGQAALSLWLLGFPDQAMIQMKQALVIAEKLSHVGSLLHGIEIGSMFHRFRQDVGEVEKLAGRMIALSREEDFAALEAKGALFRGWTLGRRGKVEEAIESLSTGIEQLRSIDASEDLPFFYDMLAECCARGERTDEGLRALDTALAEVERTASRFWVAELWRRRGELLLKADGNHEADVRDAFDVALKTAREQKAKCLELRAATSYARWLGDGGDRVAAKDLLSPIYQQFEEGLDEADLIAARTCLDRLEPASGQG